MVGWKKEGAKKDTYPPLLVEWCYDDPNQYFMWLCYIMYVSFDMANIFFFLFLLWILL